MNMRVYPGALQGKLTVPSSKSCAHRLLLAAALCRGETKILRPGENDDVEATARCLRELGADVSGNGQEMTVVGGLDQDRDVLLDCGESGSTLRFFLPLAALRRGNTRLTGRGRLPQRPNDTVLNALRINGARAENDFLPIEMRGGLKCGVFTLSGSVSSQFFTGLLFALPLLEGDSRIVCATRLESAPYVELTRQVLAQFGIVSIPTEDGWIVPGGQIYVSPGTVATEGDWSAAAFWLGANALGAQISLDGLRKDSCQADKAAEAMLKKIGGEMDVSDAPDLMPMLAAAAASVPGEDTHIIGGARLRIKESDRIHAMAQAIRAMGGCVEEEPEGMRIHGRRLTGGTVDGAGDHRVVMSAAIAACFAQGPTNILGAEAVRKSYPGFFRDLQALGGKCDEYIGE